MVLGVQQQSTQSSQLFVFGLCIAFRFMNAYLTRTYDNPDEYWQGQEVAHNIVFGYGYETWEWREQIRSYAHPLVFAMIYKVVCLLGLDNTHVLVAAPRYFQAFLGAIADVSTYSLAKRIFGNDIALPMLFTTLCSWFNFLMAARTLSNSMEMVFTIVALNYWPLPGVATLNTSWLKRYRIALTFALIACVMRPTNGLVWLFLGIHLIWKAKGYRFQVIFNALMLSVLVMTCSALIDTRVYNGKWGLEVFTPFLFFKVNVVNEISLFYGVHTWHWYISQGLPVVLTTFLPLFIFGLSKIFSQPAVYQRVKPLLLLSLWVIVIYSLLPHKEFRFIFPIVPILLMVTAFGLQQIGSSRWRKRIILLLLATQLPFALYVSLWHQRGVVDVMLWLRGEPTVKSVGVLMPCHSTPWYSMVHRKDIDMWFLTCEPPLKNTTLDEADLFYKDPLYFLDNLQQNELRKTSHLILFENLVPKIDKYLSENGYTECKRFFNSHFHDDARRRGDVVVLCRL